jgi:hypothetical protein
MSQLIKLISRLEYDLINSNQLSFIDTFSPNDFYTGKEFLMRCYFVFPVSNVPMDITATCVSVSALSYNSVSDKRLYRVNFRLN